MATASAPKTRGVTLAAISTFPDDATRACFYSALEQAQNATLAGDVDTAHTQCLAALRIRPHPSVFALMETIAEQRRDFGRARELRFLQAFFSRDAVLWRELYQDYMDSGDFFRAVVCLKRLTALTTDSDERRQLTLDRADLLIGIGEVPQALTAYEGLWRASNHQDYEVFASLAGLLFQTRRVQRLSTLVERAKARMVADAKAARESAAVKKTAADAEPPLQGAKPQGKRTRSKQQAASTPSAAADENNVVPAAVEPAARRFNPRNYMTLVNVECEVALERGHYDAVVKAATAAAMVLKCDLLDLHPDVLVRVCIAFAYRGDRAACLETLDAVVERNTPDDYGDVMYDAAAALVSLGWHREARGILQRLLQHEPLRIAAVYHTLGRAASGDGDVSAAMAAFRRALALDPGNIAARIDLAKLLLEMADTDAARDLVALRTSDDAYDAVLLRAELCRLECAAGRDVAAVTAALPVFEALLIATGDEDSVATGVTRAASNASRGALLPSVVRTSSVIVPVLSVADAAGGGPAASLAAASGMLGGTVAGGNTVAGSIAAAHRATHAPRSAIALSQQTTVAATTIAGAAQGGGPSGPQAIFRFKKTRGSKKEALAAAKRARDGAPPDADCGDAALAQPPRAQPTARALEAPDVGNLDDLADMEAALADAEETPPRPTRHQGVSFADDDMATTPGSAAEQSPRSQQGQFPAVDADGAVAAVEGGGSDALPSLDAVAASFDDDDFAAAFHTFTANFTKTDKAAATDADDAVAHAPGTAGRLEGIQHDARARQAQTQVVVTQKDVVRLLGVDGVVALARRVVDGYVRLGQASDARSFCLCIKGAMNHAPRDLRGALTTVLEDLATELALSTGELTHAVNHVLSKLQRTSERDAAQREGLWRALNTIALAAGSPSAIVLRLVQGHVKRPLSLEEAHAMDNASTGAPGSETPTLGEDAGADAAATRGDVAPCAAHRRHPQLAIIRGNVHFVRGSYNHALAFYGLALQHPALVRDASLHLLVGLAFLMQTASRELSLAARHQHAAEGCAYLERYFALSRHLFASDPCVEVEAAYNVGRAFHFVELFQKALPLYERVLELTERCPTGWPPAAPVGPDVDCRAAAAARRVRYEASAACAERTQWLRGMRRTAAHNIVAVHRLSYERREIDSQTATSGNKQQRPLPLAASAALRIAYAVLAEVASVAV